jgi:hypothetical protein
VDPLQQLSRIWAFAFRTIEPQNQQVGLFRPSSERELIWVQHSRGSRCSSCVGFDRKKLNAK